MKKRTLLKVLLLVGMVMTNLSGCGENRNSREWIENKVSEVSRVYPTENLFELFEEFPEGFTITQTFYQDAYRVTVYLDGSAKNKTVKGSIERVMISTKPYREKVEDYVDVEYKDGEYVFSDVDLANKLWVYKGFLFQKLKLDKEHLSQMDSESFKYYSNRNVYEIYYLVNNSEINKFLNSEGSHILSISGAASYNNEQDYRLNVNLESEKNSHDGLSEIVSTWSDDKKSSRFD